MGFWGRLFGRTEFDTTVTAYQSAPRANEPFRMVVEDAFTITGRGTVVTGTVESGLLGIRARVLVTNPDGTSFEAGITGIEMFRKQTNVAVAGEMVGLLLDAGGRDDFHRGAVITRLP